MKLSHIYWFTNYNLSSPSGRYRAKYPLEMLAGRGIGSTLVYPGYALKNIIYFTLVFFTILFFRKKHSLIVFQKIYTKGIYAAALKTLLFFHPKHTVYDIDDAEYLKFSPETIHHFMKYCSSCTAGSKSLVEYARQYNPNVFLLSSPVIPHPHIKTKKNNVLTIGWIGYYNAHRESLKQLFFPALSQLDFPVRFILLGVDREQHRKEVNAYFSMNKAITVEIPEYIDWNDENSVYERIKEFDFGISPLLDTEMNRAKSAFKLKQYLSCGVPVLASPVGENLHFLQEQLTGYFCHSPEEFRQLLSTFRTMPDEAYALLSANALKSVQYFSLENYCDELEGLCLQRSKIALQLNVDR
jgi:glycosyltransferase involved in cell wall biosynthesis